ncbi:MULTISPECIES: hypothetical protein [Agrobacterium]|uniref:hypothetical protein n=1 Tax=Agrobacterium TaxID=357 RepID=UPI003BA128DD
MLQARNPLKILVFLPQAAGATIVSKLAEHGYESVMVSTVPEAFDALRSDQFVFAITTRPDIDVLRNIRAIPVINLEVFFHAGILRHGSEVNSKLFDSNAFFERVKFLAHSTAPRMDVESDRAGLPKMQRNARWWVIAANALRQRRFIRRETNVQS